MFEEGWLLRYRTAAPSRNRVALSGKYNASRIKGRSGRKTGCPALGGWASFQQRLRDFFQVQGHPTELLGTFYVFIHPVHSSGGAAFTELPTYSLPCCQFCLRTLTHLLSTEFTNGKGLPKSKRQLHHSLCGNQ